MARRVTPTLALGAVPAGEREGLAIRRFLELLGFRCSDVEYSIFNTLDSTTRPLAFDKRNSIDDLHDASRDEPPGAGLPGLDPLRTRRLIQHLYVDAQGDPKGAATHC